MSLQQLAAISDKLKAQAEMLPEGPEELRNFYEELATHRPMPSGVAQEVVDANGVPARWFRPEGITTPRKILYFHGGGYAIGSPTTHATLTAQLALSAQAEVLSVDYRLAPEHPHPAASEDALKAYQYLIDNGTAPSNITLAGDSAGGGLAITIATIQRDAGQPLPGAIVSFCPWLDMACTGESLTDRADQDPYVTQEMLKGLSAQFIADGDPCDPIASPLYAELEGLPPMLVQVGTAEVLLSDATRIAARAEVAGVDVTLEIWDDMIHVWQIYTGILDEAKEALDKAGTFIQKHTSNNPQGAPA